MFRRLKILSLLQLSEKGITRRSTTKMQALGTAGKTLFFIGLSYGLFTVFFYLMFNIVFLRASTSLFIFLVFILQALSVITSTVSLSHDLYMSRDNMILMTYPVKHVEIFVSKLLVAYIIELRKSLVMTFPLFMAYATAANGVMNANFAIGSVFYAILLPLIPVLVGSLLSIPFVYLSKVIKKANWVRGFFTLALFGLLIALSILFVNWLNQIGEIRLVAIWNRFLNDFEAFLSNVNRFALHCNFVGLSLLEKDGLQAFLNYLWFFLVLAGMVGLVVLAALPTFYRLSSSASENASSRQHKGKNKAHRSTYFTFVRKETTLALRNLSNFASDYVFLFAMPFILVLLMTLFTHINRNTLGYSLTYGILAFITLVLLSVSNTASATAISSEGNEFVLLKTAPGDTRNIIWSKLLLNFVIAIGSTLFSFILLTIFLQPDVSAGKINLGLIWMIFGLAVLLETGQLLGAIQYDILHPRLREFANSQNKNDIRSSSHSVISGLVTALMGTVLVFVMVMFLIPGMVGSMGEAGAVGICTLISLLVGFAYVGIRFYFLIQYRNAYFEDIQL